jgi:molybdenum cofactor cytidylyltransferase
MDPGQDGVAPGRDGPVAGIILAAGASTRLGVNKLLLEVGGEPLLRRVARAALAAGLEPLVVVLGHEAERTEGALAGLPCRTVRNPDHARGQGTSLRKGLDALPPGAPAAVVLLGDMPLVRAELVAALLDRYRRSLAPLVVSDYGGVVAPPTLYDRTLFAELTEPGERPGRAVVQRHRAEALVVPCPAEALADVDLPADLAGLGRTPAREP